MYSLYCISIRILKFDTISIQIQAALFSQLHHQFKTKLKIGTDRYCLSQCNLNPDPYLE